MINIRKRAEPSQAEKAAKLEAEKVAKLEAETARQTKFEAELEQRARTRFFSKNHAASEELYQSVREDIRRELLLEKRDGAAVLRNARHSVYRETFG
jgi:hypothetical protein